jgi:hypothetical protein
MLPGKDVADGTIDLEKTQEELELDDVGGLLHIGLRTPWSDFQGIPDRLVDARSEGLCGGRVQLSVE